MAALAVQMPREYLELRRRDGTWRYKVGYGGRVGTKSWLFARTLLLMASQSKLLILCAREVQKSIGDSVHRLLSEQISMLGLAGWEIEKARIYHQNGSEILFTGLRDSAKGLKSYEGVDICWVEEAQNVTAASWDTLDPTIRKHDSEIWVSFNPDLESDPTFQRFIVKPPPRTWVKKMNYDENPWCPPQMRAQAEHCRATDMAAYRHIWLGECKPAVDGAIYEAELARALDGGRITRVTHDPMLPVHTAWDLGLGDGTAVWIWQQAGQMVRLLGYMERQGVAITLILGELQRMAAQAGWVWGTDYLPWDGARKDPDGRAIDQRFRSLGRKVHVNKQQPVHVGIDAVRTLFGSFWIDSAGCEDGLMALRHYQYERLETTLVGGVERHQMSRTPLHNWASHGADALRTLAMGVRTPRPGLVRDNSPGVWDHWRGVSLA